VKKSTDNLDAIAEKIRAGLSAKDAVREKMLPLSRDVIRYCSQAIRALHRQEFSEAENMLGTARDILAGVGQVVSECNEFLNTGAFRDAQKEYAEGCITLAVVRGEPIPDPDELQIDLASYLNGMGEAVGELRRYLLDSMRRGDTSRGEELLSAMDDIYTVLVAMDFPDAVTGGLRRTTDNVRGILERTRGDLTLAVQNKELETRLSDFQQRLPPTP
jgi:translin